MRNELVTYAFIGILALVQAALISAWPLPASLLCPSLILVSALALNLKPKTAVIAAIFSGLILDQLSPSFYGLHALASVLSVSITSLLLFRVLTHHTITAVAGVNAAVFLLFHLLLYVFNTLLRALSAGPLIHPASGQALLMVLAALPIQIAIAVSVSVFLKGISGYTSRFILVK